MILKNAKKTGFITTEDVVRLCKLNYKEQALVRLYLLAKTNNLKLKRSKTFKFYYKSSKIPTNLPTINDIKRDHGWR